MRYKTDPGTEAGVTIQKAKKTTYPFFPQSM